MLTDNVANIESVFLCHVIALQEPAKSVADTIQTKTFLSDSDNKKEEADSLMRKSGDTLNKSMQNIPWTVGTFVRFSVHINILHVLKSQTRLSIQNYLCHSNTPVTGQLT